MAALGNSLVSTSSTSFVSAITAPSGVKYVLIGCNIANTTTGDIYIDIQVDTGSVQYYYIKNLYIPKSSSVKLVKNSEKIVLLSGHSLTVKNNTVGGSVDVITSYAEV